MARRSKQDKPELIRAKLVELLNEFEAELKKTDLRKKVQSLVPAHHLLRDLGSSLMEDVEGAKDRIIKYLCKYPRVVIPGNELMVVSGIGEWARRTRELRVEQGWSIVSGVTVKEMLEVGDMKLEDIGGVKLKPDHYILLDETQDRDAAFRWNRANEIRKKKISVQNKIIEFFRENVGKPITGEELRYLANNKSEWPRRVRELRTEHGWPIVSRITGDPSLAIGTYVLQEDRQAEVHDRKIPDTVRVQVLERDHFQCTSCNWKTSDLKPEDPRRFLELHHMEHHVKGGENTRDNLITFCNVCHDDIHKRKLSVEDFLSEKGKTLKDILR